MKTINNFIIEKLKLNKDTKMVLNKEDKLFSYIDNYIKPIIEKDMSDFKLNYFEKNIYKWFDTAPIIDDENFDGLVQYCNEETFDTLTFYFGIKYVHENFTVNEYLMEEFWSDEKIIEISNPKNDNLVCYTPTILAIELSCGYIYFMKNFIL